MRVCSFIAAAPLRTRPPQPLSPSSSRYHAPCIEYSVAVSQHYYFYHSARAPPEEEFDVPHAQPGPTRRRGGHPPCSPRLPPLSAAAVWVPGDWRWGPPRVDAGASLQSRFERFGMPRIVAVVRHPQHSRPGWRRTAPAQDENSPAALMERPELHLCPSPRPSVGRDTTWWVCCSAAEDGLGCWRCRV